MSTSSPHFPPYPLIQSISQKATFSILFGLFHFVVGILARFHPGTPDFSSRARAVAAMLKFLAKPTPEVDEVRKKVDLLSAFLKTKYQYDLEQVKGFNGVPLEIVTAKVAVAPSLRSWVPEDQPIEPRKGAVLYFHGGGYIAGRAWHYREMAGELSGRLSGMPVVLVDYRLAPEANLNESFEDGVSSWRYIADRYGAENVIIMGDSAGGGMVVNVISLVIQRNLPLPRGAIPISPFWNLANDDAFCDPSLASVDTILNLSDIHIMKDLLADSIRQTSPDMIYESGGLKTPAMQYLNTFQTWPETLILVGANEMLLSQSVDLYKRLKKIGSSSESVKAELIIQPFMHHVYPIFWSFSDENENGMVAIVNFIRAKVGWN